MSGGDARKLLNILELVSQYPGGFKSGFPDD